MNDRSVTYQQRPPGVRSGTIVAPMLLRRVSVTGYQMAVQSESRIVDENVVTRETSLLSKSLVGLSLLYVLSLNPDKRNRRATVAGGREALRLEGYKRRRKGKEKALYNPLEISVGSGARKLARYNRSGAAHRPRLRSVQSRMMTK